MLRIPIHISCDSCGLEREPTPHESRERLAQALARAREEGWSANKDSNTHTCPHCRNIAPRRGRQRSAAAPRSTGKKGLLTMTIVSLD